MKSFIIAGASRSGKTTLSRRLQKHTGFSLVSSDALVSTFEWTCPSLNVSHAGDFDTTSQNLLGFIIPYVDHMVTYQDIPFILDIFHLTPQQVAERDLHRRYNVIFLGFPNISVDGKLNAIRTHKTAHYDWTDERSDDELREGIASGIAHSQRIAKEAAAAGLRFVDTSTDFTARLDKAFADLTHAA